MSRNIDLTSILSTEKPSITIQGKKFTVNDEKSNILRMNSTMKKYQESGETEIEVIDKVLEILIGKKATQEIDKMGFSFIQYQEIYFAVMAVVQDESLEVVKERFRKQ
ncbi:MAG: hypothetical protein ACK5KR_08935 [Breznakia sp.]